MLFDTIHDSGTSMLTNGTPGDYSPPSRIALFLDRTDPRNFALPNASEIAGDHGESSFASNGPVSSSGTGILVAGVAPSAMPEPSTLAHLGGTLALGIVARRRSSVPVTRR